jgi:site-specific recombinase
LSLLFKVSWFCCTFSLHLHSYRQSFNDKGRKFCAFSSPLLLGISLDKFLIYIFTDKSLSLLLVDITAAIYSERSVRSLLTTNSELIALQVTENASKTGEHYVSTDKQGFLAMYKSAAGAGVIIAIMATLKTLSARMVMAPLMQAFIYSMNYSLGFMLIHVLHFTVATKQPAMTAAALASTVQHRKGSKMAQIAELAALIINSIPYYSKLFFI